MSCRLAILFRPDHAMTSAITMVLPVPVAIFTAHRVYASPEPGCSRRPFICSGASARNTIVSTASCWQKNGRVAVGNPAVVEPVPEEVPGHGGYAGVAVCSPLPYPVTKVVDDFERDHLVSDLQLAVRRGREVPGSPPAIADLGDDGSEVPVPGRFSEGVVDDRVALNDRPWAWPLRLCWWRSRLASGQREARPRLRSRPGRSPAPPTFGVLALSKGRDVHPCSSSISSASTVPRSAAGASSRRR